MDDDGGDVNGNGNGPECFCRCDDDSGSTFLVMILVVSSSDSDSNNDDDPTNAIRDSGCTSRIVHSAIIGRKSIASGRGIHVGPNPTGMGRRKQ